MVADTVVGLNSEVAPDRVVVTNTVVGFDLDYLEGLPAAGDKVG